MKIAFVGGGTLGPVMPLVAVSRAFRKLQPHASFVWIGTPDGPEKSVVEAEGIPFHALPVAKLPRYPSFTWLTFSFAWARVRAEAERLVDRLKPSAIVSAGGFTAVPVVYAAVKRGIPCFTHQLDLEPGLSNKKIARLCKSVTTSFEYERGPFGYEVTDERIPTPTLFADASIPSKEKAAQTFGLNPKEPIVFLFGGGTGAKALNDVIERKVHRWVPSLQLIHGTGIGKEGTPLKKELKGYVRIPFLGEKMLDAYAAADVVICRAGMGTLSEIASLSKAAIVVPMPHSHQESNAKAFEEQGACAVVNQNTPNFADELLTAAILLSSDRAAQKKMGERANVFLPTDDGTEFAKRILRGLEK